MVDIITEELYAIDELVIALTAEHSRVKGTNAIRAGNCQNYIERLKAIRETVAGGTSLKERDTLWAGFEVVMAKTVTLIGTANIPKAVNLEHIYKPQKPTRAKPVRKEKSGFFGRFFRPK